MENSRFTDSQIIAVLKQAEAGTPVPELCREHGIGSGAFYKRRNKFGGMDASLMAQLQELQHESRRLKKMYAEAQLSADLLKEARRLQPHSPLRLAGTHPVRKRAGAEQATRCLWSYNHERPNVALCGITPMQKLAWTASLHFLRPLEASGLPLDMANSSSVPMCSPHLLGKHEWKRSPKHGDLNTVPASPVNK